MKNTKREPDPTPREVLSVNLRSLMAAHPTLTSIKKVADATKNYRLEGEDVSLSNGKVGRIAAGSHTTDINALYSIAKAFGLHPWQLLVHGLNPKALPRLMDATVLNQILDAFTQSGSEGHALASPTSDTHPLEEPASPKLGPAMRKAKDLRGVGTSRGTNQPSGVQKPKPRHRRGG